MIRFFSLFLVVMIQPLAASMIISGVMDGPLSRGTPKVIELYVQQDVADLSRFGLGCANNGGGSDGQEYTFPDSHAVQGQFIYVASESTYFADFFGFAPDYVHSVANINGDDAIELYEDSTVVDVFGDVELDGTGEPWEYRDGWAYRAECGESGTFILEDWTFSQVDIWGDAAHNSDAEIPFPLASFEETVAIVLSSLEAVMLQDKIQVRWRTDQETSCAGFNVLRSSNREGPFHRLNETLIPAVGGGNSGERYLYDDYVLPQSAFFYQIERIDLEGGKEVWGPVQAEPIQDIDSHLLPLDDQRIKVAPNPFNSSTVVELELEHPGRIQLTIYNRLGREVKQLYRGFLYPGKHAFSWDGCDAWGTPVPSGMYICCVKAKERRALIQKVALVR